MPKPLKNLASVRISAKMDKLEFTFADYSPLIPEASARRSEEERAKLRDNLKKLCGQTGEAEDLETLVSLFCTKVQNTISSLHKNGSEAFPLDISLLLPSVNNREREPKRPMLFKEDYSGRWYTQGYVGVIRLPIREYDVTIRIHSRFDPPDSTFFFSHVLEKAFELESGEAKGVVYGGMETEDIMGMERLLDRVPLCLFFRQLNTALRAGPYRQYQDFFHNDSNVRGRIDVPRHIRENPFPNGKISYVTREHSVDNPVNRLILKTAACLQRKYRAAYTRMLRGNERCAGGLAMLEGELFDAPPVSEHQAIRDAGKKIVQSVYKNYEPLRKTCISILRHFGVDSAQDRNKRSGYLLDMTALWEVFLHNTVLRGFEDVLRPYSQQNYSILEGKRAVRPDFLYPKQGVVLDAKYRDVWGKVYGGTDSWGDRTREDILQLIAYMHIFRCKTGGVVFPIRGAAPSSIESNEFKIDAMEEGVETSRFPLPEERFVLLPYYIPTSCSKPAEFEAAMENSAKCLRPHLETLLQQSDP